MDGEDLVGIITERDVLKAAATGLPMDDTRISRGDDQGPGDGRRRGRPSARRRRSWPTAGSATSPSWTAGAWSGILSQRDLAGVLAGALNEPETLERSWSRPRSSPVIAA